MPEYINPNMHPVILTGPNGEIIKVASRQKVVLPEFYERYRKRGFLRLVTNTIVSSHDNARKLQSQIKIRLELNKKNKQAQEPESQKESDAAPSISPLSKAKTTKIINRRRSVEEEAKKRARHAIYRDNAERKTIVGKAANVDGNNILRNNLASGYPISNNISVGILSYNRKSSLERLINSIETYTDLDKTTVFISDDCSDKEDLLIYLEELQSKKYVIIKNDKRLGVAGNTNRLLLAMSRFKYGLLLNDDVEVTRPGWDTFYFENMAASQMQHFIYRQPGVYGAELGESVNINGVQCAKTESRPQGSVLAYTHSLFKTIGYFDESFGYYGMEHVDWSRRAYESGAQPPGFFDVVGSNAYFIIHAEESAVPNRIESLKAAKVLYADKYDSVSRDIYVDKSAEIKLEAISYVIPFRNIERTGAIETIVKNIRAQKFAFIDIILVEHDDTQKLDHGQIYPSTYKTIDTDKGHLFNKSKAFNLGVSLVNTDSVILHDADIMLRSDYTLQIYNILKQYDACHIGKTVIYADQDSSQRIILNGSVDSGNNINRVVGYFEGGSLACTVKSYWKCGAFNEDYWGYGCFLPGNKVITNRGLISIEDVIETDELLTHEGNYKKQRSRVRHYKGSVLDIFIPGRLPIKGVTPNHPFLVHDTGNEYVWREARDLREGDLLAQTDVLPDLSPTNKYRDTKDKDMCLSEKATHKFEELSCSLGGVFDDDAGHKSGIIYDIREYQYDGLVYNFEVEDDHSYYVHGISVHNCEDCDFFQRLSKSSKWYEVRIADFLHLYHGRVPNWESHHQINKALEQSLTSKPLEERLSLQYSQLISGGYEKFISEHMVR
jgi:GT2 family glycosyltransferase